MNAAPLAVLCAALALAGCGGIDGLWGDDVVLPCPNVRVIGEGSVFPLLEEDAEAESDLALEARIVGFEAACDYDDSEDPSSGMDMSLTVLFGAERSAGSASGESLPFFVAAVGPDRTVAIKRSFTTGIAFDSPEARIGRSEPEAVDLRFPAGAALRPWEYEVLIGFQLDRRQLDHLRRR